MIGRAFVPEGTCGEGSRRNVAEPFSLRPISRSAVPEAIKKAEHYRLLNDPEQAESICLDILDVDAGNQQALVVLILAMTDQFGSDHGPLSDVPLAEYLARWTTRTTAATTRASCTSVRPAPSFGERNRASLRTTAFATRWIGTRRRRAFVHPTMTRPSCGGMRVSARSTELTWSHGPRNGSSCSNSEARRP